MATRRTGKLVQRNKPPESSTNEVDPAIDIPENDDDESETKETRLTLMEEILLLGLKDREVSIGFDLKECCCERPRHLQRFFLFFLIGLHVVLE